MTHPRLARLATDALADAAVDSTPPPPSPEEEARAIQLIAEAIRERASARGRRRTLVAAGGFAVAAGVVLAIGWRSHGRGAPVTQSPVLPAASATEVTAVAHALTDGVVVLRAGAQLGLEAGGSIVRDDRVVTTNGGRASVVLSTGTHLVIEEGTDFSVVEQGSMQAFALRAGSVRADVAKLRQGQRFSIRTNDAEVEVRGTSFRVQVLPESAPCSAGIMTRVTVNEGVVAVRTSQGEVLVHKDETWPRPCSASPAAEPVPLPTVQPVGGSAASRVVPPASAAPSTVPPRSRSIRRPYVASPPPPVTPPPPRRSSRSRMPSSARPPLHGAVATSRRLWPCTSDWPRVIHRARSRRARSWSACACWRHRTDARAPTLLARTSSATPAASRAARRRSLPRGRREGSRRRPGCSGRLDRPRRQLQRRDPTRHRRRRHHRRRRRWRRRPPGRRRVQDRSPVRSVFASLRRTVGQLRSVHHGRPLHERQPSALRPRHPSLRRVRCGRGLWVGRAHVRAGDP